MTTQSPPTLKRMSRKTWIWMFCGILAVAHAGLCLFLSFTGWPDGEPYSFPTYRMKWVLKLLELPLLIFIHDPKATAGMRALEIVANSAAAGVITALVWRFKERDRIEKTWSGVLFACAMLGASIASVGSSAAALPGVDSKRESTVGIPARITDLVLPGGELEVLPQDAKTAVVLRITRVEPHGTDHRYDIEWTGLDPGRHDLRAFLRRKDGTDTSNLPEIAVDVRSVLGPGQVKPNHPPEHAAPRFGGYRGLMIGLGIAWALGLVAILFLFRKKRVEEHATRARPRTLAERLRPLVESAMAGTLDRAERAQLELGLVAYWRRRLGLDAERPDEAIAALRRHAEAGPLLNALDAWLYKPAGGERVDLAALLAPYKDLPPDALELAVETR